MTSKKTKAISKMIFVVAIMLTSAFVMATAIAQPATAAGEGTHVMSDITEDTIWTLEGSPYTVANDNGRGIEKITVYNDKKPITLIIEAGVEVIFADVYRGHYHALGIGKNAALVVKGSQENPVVFTTSNPDKTQTAKWNGVHFQSESRASKSRIDWAIFECGGWYANGLLNIPVGTPTISHSTFRYSAGNGIWVGEGASSKVTGCTFTNNGNYGIFLDNSEAEITSCRFEENSIGRAIALKNSFPTLTSNTATNDQFIHLEWDVTKSGTLGIPGTLDNGTVIPYIFGNDDGSGAEKVTVQNDTEPITLTIEAGVEVIFADVYRGHYHSLEIGKNAALVVKGTQENPVIFTTSSQNKTRTGLWNSVHFQSESRASESCIDWTIFECGGSRSYGHALLDIDVGTPTISNSIFRYSAGNGIWVGEGASSKVTGCTFTNNGNYGAWLDTSEAEITSCRFEENSIGRAIALHNCFPTLAKNTATNDQFAHVEWDITKTGTLGIPGTLDNGKGIPYIFGNDDGSGAEKVTVQNDTEPITLTIESGVEVIFANVYRGHYHSLEIGKNAALVVKGTQENPVIFTTSSQNKTRTGLWNSVHFQSESRTSESSIDWTIFECGGSRSYGHALLDIDVGTPTISNSIFRYSLSSGLYVGEAADPTITDCTFTENKIGLRFTTTSAPRISGNSIEGNTEYGAINDNKEIIIDMTENWWGNVSGPLDDSDDPDDPT